MIVTMRSSSSDVISPALWYIKKLCSSVELCGVKGVPLVKIDISFLADEIGVSPAHTFDLG